MQHIQMVQYFIKTCSLICLENLQKRFESTVYIQFISHDEREADFHMFIIMEGLLHPFLKS